ncbi:LysR family transcriptional regulator [Streptacidiphilus jiangxiensis]|uniref:DNA-binding transcriptional regulator, LysR family n=1 Tax=Streptacidiphilus jiangxiensis TaxID=235985 RepID=A0A1H7TB48_STRJI|nr:LysR family transcriptional regulator [Streptacidiphilus jiangxiensis]SEL81739.1 DNA-binding transcriptional regulator, LysR family [Streptacidiphilus jiangxiensis]
MPDSSPLPPPTFDLQLAHCFTVVAEYRHFGRAAEALHTTQPSLSRRIRRLEQQLGVRLVERTSQGNHLTEAGEDFLQAATALLRAADRAAADARSAARPGRITVGHTPGIIVTPAVRELRAAHPNAEVRVRQLASDEARAALLDHRVDAVIARLPFSTEGFEVTALYDEPRVLVVPRGHRLAGRESVTLADIADEPVPRVRGADPPASAFWRIDPRPDGRPAPDGPLIDAAADQFELVAGGQAVSISVSSHTLRPDLTTVRLEGVEASHVVLATRVGDRNRLLAAFRTHATRTLGR